MYMVPDEVPVVFFPSYWENLARCSARFKILSLQVFHQRGTYWTIFFHEIYLLNSIFFRVW